MQVEEEENGSRRTRYVVILSVAINAVFIFTRRLMISPLILLNYFDLVDSIHSPFYALREG
jgi:hypothetical protein